METIQEMAVRIKDSFVGFALKYFKEDFINKAKCVLKAADQINESWSGSPLGYHSTVYLKGFKPKEGKEKFDVEWGLNVAGFNRTCGDWVEYGKSEIEDAIIQKSSIEDLYFFMDLSIEAQKAITASIDDFLHVLQVYLFNQDDPPLNDLFEGLRNVNKILSINDINNILLPSRRWISRDSTAYCQGETIPVHLIVKANVLHYMNCLQTYQDCLKYILRIQRHFEILKLYSSHNVESKKTKIFIGHGHSKIWMELKDFLSEKLKLDYDEFTRESTAGLSTKEILIDKLNNATFAFLIMTAEDQHADGLHHARENVIHEVGLFQGKLGFEKAIVLLEQDCQEFSNILGLIQIRFPKEDIRARFEDIRDVLHERGQIS